jgi:hypothetical protein
MRRARDEMYQMGRKKKERTFFGVYNREYDEYGIVLLEPRKRANDYMKLGNARQITINDE